MIIVMNTAPIVYVIQLEMSVHNIAIIIPQLQSLNLTAESFATEHIFRMYNKQTSDWTEIWLSICCSVLVGFFIVDDDSHKWHANRRAIVCEI